MKTISAVAIALLLWSTLPNKSIAQASNSPVVQQSPAKSQKQKAKDDPKARIESLVNHNSPPKLVADQGDRIPIFDAKYDWVEYSRVWNAVRELAPHADTLWPELVKHLDDNRYCLTVFTFTESTYNWTIGDVCRELIGATLAKPYDRNLSPSSLRIYAAMSRPEIARDAKKLKAWCEERENKRLYEMQIEVCDWAIEVLKLPEFLPSVSKSRREGWIDAIGADAKSLATSKQAVLSAWFRAEEYEPYNSKRAETARNIAAQKGIK
jgi:hypothetical protein